MHTFNDYLRTYHLPTRRAAIILGVQPNTVCCYRRVHKDRLERERRFALEKRIVTMNTEGGKPASVSLPKEPWL